jgi:glycosyltransferase involved in cell wall biosynthesis
MCLNKLKRKGFKKQMLDKQLEYENTDKNKDEEPLLSDDEDDNILLIEQSQKFSEYIRLEFEELSKSPKIACVMMVKNEKKRIRVSLESVKDIISCYIIFDTGSEDDTKEIIIEYCKEYKKNLYIISGNFVNFSVSRNCLLDYADKFPIDFLLLMDTNDELRGGQELIDIAKAELNTENTAYLMCQQWWSNKYDYYWNSRFIKVRKNWRYICVVHEVLDHPTESFPTIKLKDTIVLYQDRTLDDDKTGKRFVKDKAFLRREYLKNPKDARTVFYLAQTYACLKDYTHSYRFYKERYNIVNGFWEERIQSAIRLGEICQKLNKNWDEAMGWYLKSYEICERAEPLIAISDYYNKEKIWSLSFLFAKQACELSFPHHCNLFIDKQCYDYDRYQRLGIVAFYYDKFPEGKWGCEKALENKPDSELDKNNLKFYILKEKELKETQISNITKNDYFKLRQKKIKQENPNMRPKQILTKIKLEWKIKNLKLE